MKKLLFAPLFLLSVIAFGQESLDKIFLVDRSILEGKIQSINETQIIFQEIATPGIYKPIRLVTIWKIIYSNGYEEVFNEPLPENLIASDNNQKNEKSNPLSKLMSKTKTEEIPNDKNIQARESNFLTTLAYNQTWRPLVDIHLGAYPPIIFGPENWTATTGGLALRYGYGGEFGISINPIKYLGITVSHGFSNHFSFLPEMPGIDSTSVNGKEKINLIKRPSSIKLNIYPKEDIILTAGMMFSNVSISNSEPEVINEAMNGYTFGLGKIFPVGNKKNYISLTANYNMLNTEGFTFSLSQEKFPDLEPLNLDFKTLTTIDLKLQFHFGILN